MPRPLYHVLFFLGNCESAVCIRIKSRIESAVYKAKVHYTSYPVASP